MDVVKLEAQRATVALDTEDLTLLAKVLQAAHPAVAGRSAARWQAVEAMGAAFELAAAAVAAMPAADGRP